jgi:hypothetical protein
MLPLTYKSANKYNENSTRKGLWSAFKTAKEVTPIDFINVGGISFNISLSSEIKK